MPVRSEPSSNGTREPRGGRALQPSEQKTDGARPPREPFRMPRKILKRINTALEELAADRPVLLAFLVFLLATMTVIPIALPFYLHDEDFFRELVAEAHGTLFDLLIIGWFLFWLRVRAETRVNNNRYREEIEDFLGWRSLEATHRIAGNIRRLNRGGVKEGLRLTHAYLKEANLDGASLKEADLWGADLERASLGGAILTGANMAGANLEGAELERADLTRADLRGAVLEGSDLERATLAKADLRGTILNGADLQYAILTDADMERAELAEANLREADLRGVKLRRANLRGVGFRGANLKGADLRGADLDGADLERASLLGAVLPEGDELLTTFAEVRSLFRAQLDPPVEERLQEAYPRLFAWMQDSDIY